MVCWRGVRGGVCYNYVYVSNVAPRSARVPRAHRHILLHTRHNHEQPAKTVSRSGGLNISFRPILAFIGCYFFGGIHARSRGIALSCWSLLLNFSSVPSCWPFREVSKPRCENLENDASLTVVDQTLMLPEAITKEKTAAVPIVDECPSKPTRS